MAHEKRKQQDEAKEKDERHEDLELPEEAAEGVKGGDAGWDIKANQKT
jgi:hypothetical protein